MTESQKKALIRVFAYPPIGRPLRKIMWMVLLFLRNLTGMVDRIFSRMPYVQKYNEMLSFAMGHMDQIVSYYRTVSMDLGYQPYKPKISILLPVYNPPIEYFRECLGSVAFQIYQEWELCIVDDCSTDPAVWAEIESFSARFPGRVKTNRNTSNQHISFTSNRCLELASGEYVALLDHDDRLFPVSLAEVARHLNLVTGEPPEVIYSDEQVIDAKGDPRVMPFFKPGWSPQFHLRVNYTTHLSVYKRSLIESIGGFRVGLEGAQDHDLFLRAVENAKTPVMHIPMVLYQWRSHEASTAGGLESKPYAAEAGERAVREHLERTGRAAKVSWDKKTQHYRIQYEIENPSPLVSVVICSKDSYKLISDCLDTILRLTTYQNFEIVLVDNGSTDPQCLELFSRLQSEMPHSFRWVVFDQPFNFAAMNNLGVSKARGEFVVLLNNDTRVISPEWLQEMVQLAQFPEIGAVGPRLLYEDGRVQHAGVAHADRSIAIHMCQGFDPDDKHYVHVLNTVHETAAVTGACLCIRKSKYLEVGGLLERFVANGFGDVDFCIRLRRAGYANVYTPHAQLFHLESPTRKQTFEFFERNYLIRNYSSEIMNDPYMNPNLDRGHFYNPSLYSMHFQLTNEAFQYLLATPMSKWSSEDFHSQRKMHRSFFDARVRNPVVRHLGNSGLVQ